MCLSKVSETVRWRLMQPKGLRRSRLWASPVEMFKVVEEDGRRRPPQRLFPQPREKSPRAMLLCACLGWRRITATPRLEHQMFEGKGPLECRHIGAPRACKEIACKPRTVAYPDVCADHSPFTFPDRDHSTGCESSMIYPPGLESTDGRTVHPRSVRESMSWSSPSAESVALLTVPAHLSPQNASELSSIWKSKDARVENMKSIRIVGEVVRLSRTSLYSVSAPFKHSIEVEHDVPAVFAVVGAPPPPMYIRLLQVGKLW